MGLAVAIIVGLIVITLVWILLSGVVLGKSSAEPALGGAPDQPGVETLRYRIPDEQDPAVLISALDLGGYTADLEEIDGDKYLNVACPAGRDADRPRIREVIEGAHTTKLEGSEFDPGQVAFEDEK